MLWTGSITTILFSVLFLLAIPQSSSKVIGNWFPRNLFFFRGTSRLACDSNSFKLRKPVNIVMVGAPAAGKGTHCDLMKKKYGLVHLSVGDILRQSMLEDTDVGKRVKLYMEKGSLVPDDVVIDVVFSRLSQEDCLNKGWLLDGFPRTKIQAEALKSSKFAPHLMLFLDTPESLLLERVLGRRVDPLTGENYHLKFRPPENETVASRLIQRGDDNEEMLRNRLVDFRREISPVLGVFEKVLHVIEGHLPLESSLEKIHSLIHPL